MVKPQIYMLCLVLTILFAISTVNLVYSIKESTSNFGSLMIDNDTFSIKEDQYSILQISGNAVNSTSGVRVLLFMDKPDGSTVELKTIPNNVGEFNTSLILDANWEKGDYTIHAFYMENQIGTVNFSITDVQKPNIISSSNIGSVFVEDENYVLPSNGTVIIEIYGKIIDYDKNESILFSLKKPDGTLEDFSANGKKTGDYITRLTAKDDWQVGKYYVIATYKGEKVDEVSFTLDADIVSQSKITQIPKWVKDNAEWWADGITEDKTFVDAIRYLIQEDVLKLPPTTPETEYENEIPKWIKTNAGLWAEGTIDDQTFVSGIQWLVSNGIIIVS